MNTPSESAFLPGVFNSVPTPIFALDDTKRFVLVNQAFNNLFAMSPKDVMGKPIDQVLPPDTGNLFIREPGPNNCEILIRNSTGTEIPFQVSVVRATVENRPFDVYTLRDITEHKRVEESMRDSEVMYRTLVNQLPNPILIHINGNVVFANDLILGITGFSKDEVIGKNVADLLTDPTDTKNQAISRNLTGETLVEEEEFEIRTANRKVVIKNFLLRNSRIKYKGQDAIMTILIDITERKHLEKYVLTRVIETEEKDRKRFATDLHDDLGPLLSSIKLHLGLLEHARTPEKSAEMLAICNQQLEETIVKMRVVANNLMPRLLEKFGLEAAINAFINTMQHEGVFTIRMASNLKGRRFPKQTELHVYRICCELINNTAKHAGASGATVKLNYAKGLLVLDYSDNGKGYNVTEINTRPGGLGLGNIIQRVNLIDAQIQFSKRRGKTAVCIRKEI